ncbi:protein-glutamate methylesterase/protein-glutamine glutaminase [Nocardioides daphniae]|uniref:Protein-glutamate methylesterase/protein-glutamine glutaminase n=1 Tax=Nocardioides daphniae TaxID=402297 RepID=A0A4P7UHL7_9ACTN|nr:chemotaxis response regulator protein-glutamate methylesterase [Nocardioides daphniae]QCC78139.1 chemotaxis response regulator protein-glutamate methylesterase [Nocardioides daphniae]GGD21546.1 chemotaxis response regulator protein-glutamate methylesterase of group 2 operon [Nocardioides daphniae]
MPPIRVLVVDDSVVIRRLVTGLLSEDPDIEVVGTAINGRAALQKLETLTPDLVTMDIEMPEMNGIEAVRAIRASGNRVPIVMFSTLTERGASATFDALSAGASDYVPKPANVGSVSRSMEQVRDALIPLIKSLVPRAGSRLSTPARATVGTTAAAAPSVVPPTPATRERRVPATGYRLLAVGSSTGGPEALFTVLTSLPPLPVPVVVVQHMPPVFTTQFAARLDRHCDYPVREATDGAVLAPGTVTIAPGDFHLVVERAGRDLVARLNQQPPENYCRPAVDVLFRSAAVAANGPVLGLVLTGMGQDGARGAQHLVDAGGSVLAQDRATSVVWGMPGAVASAGLAEQLLPLGQVAGEVRRRLAAIQTDDRGGEA